MKFILSLSDQRHFKSDGLPYLYLAKNNTFMHKTLLRFLEKKSLSYFLHIESVPLLAETDYID